MHTDNEKTFINVLPIKFISFALVDAVVISTCEELLIFMFFWVLFLRKFVIALNIWTILKSQTRLKFTSVN